MRQYHGDLQLTDRDAAKFNFGGFRAEAGLSRCVEHNALPTSISSPATWLRYIIPNSTSASTARTHAHNMSTTSCWNLMNAGAPGIAMKLPIVCLPPQPRPVKPPQHSSEYKSAPAPFDDQTRPHVVFVAKQGPDDPWERVGLFWYMESSLASISSPVWADIIAVFPASHDPPPSKRLKTADGSAVANEAKPPTEPLRGPTIIISNCTTERLGVILRTCHPAEQLDLRPASIKKDDLWAIYDIAAHHDIKPTLSWLRYVLQELAPEDPDDWARECWKGGWQDGLVTCCQLSYSPTANRKRTSAGPTVMVERTAWKDADKTYFDACSHQLQQDSAIILRGRGGVWDLSWLDVDQDAVWFSCAHYPHAKRERLRPRTGGLLWVHAWFINDLVHLQRLVERHPTSSTITETKILGEAHRCGHCKLKAAGDIDELTSTLVRFVDSELSKACLITWFLLAPPVIAHANVESPQVPFPHDRVTAYTPEPRVTAAAAS